LAKSIGGQKAEARVFLFLYVDDFKKAYRNFKGQGAIFLKDPQNVTYGMAVKS
jgi:hypothetical protein